MKDCHDVRMSKLTDMGGSPPSDYHISIDSCRPGLIALGCDEEGCGGGVIIRSGFVRTVCNRMLEMARLADKFPVPDKPAGKDDKDDKDVKGGGGGK